MQDAKRDQKQKQALYVLIGNLLVKENNRLIAVRNDDYFTIAVLNVIFEFLVPESCASQRLFQAVPKSPAYLLERRSYLSKRLRYLVAVEGEDNHHKTQNFLEQHADLASELISEQCEMTDAAGRFFPVASVYGHLFWAGNTDLLNILDRFTDLPTQRRLSSECHDIEAHGLKFMCNEKWYQTSHFPMRPVIEAAYQYDAISYPLYEQKKQGTEEWKQVEILWLKLAEELGKVPLWIAQLFCSNLGFCPPPSLDKLEFERTIMFYNAVTCKPDTWFINGKPNPLFGQSLGISKANADRAWGFAQAPRVVLKSHLSDLTMLTTIYKTRMLHDPKRILKKLAQTCEAQSHDLSAAKMG